MIFTPILSFKMHSTRPVRGPLGATRFALSSHQRALSTKLCGCTCFTRWRRRLSTAKLEILLPPMPQTLRHTVGTSFGRFTLDRLRVPMVRALVCFCGHWLRSAARNSPRVIREVALRSPTRKPLNSPSLDLRVRLKEIAMVSAKRLTTSSTSRLFHLSRPCSSMCTMQTLPSTVGRAPPVFVLTMNNGPRAGRSLLRFCRDLTHVIKTSRNSFATTLISTTTLERP
mmetsp:Transcript_2282/g.5878  ORF Transcript_2282/g.5878 Transcript_2282/m.5878 type:complete len:227 (+) Transcript_2282:7390-8070(+)